MADFAVLERLARQISDGLAELDGNARRWLWCDGLVITGYHLDAEPPRLVGHAWMSGVAGLARGAQEQWPFELHFDRRAIRDGDIDWQLLADASNGTAWLTVDRVAKTLAIDLRAS